MLVFDLRIKRKICRLEGIRIVVNATVNIGINRAYNWNQKGCKTYAFRLKFDYPNLHIMYAYLLYYVLYDYILDSPGCEYPPSRHFTCSLSARNFLENLKRMCRKFVQVITFPFYSMYVPLPVSLLAKRSISCFSANSSLLTITASASQMCYPYTTYEVTEDSQ